MGLILYVVGIPVLQLVMLRRFGWGDHADAAAFLGYRVTGYKHGFRWWDSADIVWRLSVALSIQLLMDHPPAQLALFTLLIAARLVAQRRFRPFVETLNNVEENMLEWLTLGVLACGCVFYAFRSRLSDAAQAFLFVLVVVFLAIIVLCVVRATLLAFRGRKRFDSDGSRGGSDSTSRADSRDIDSGVIDFAELSESRSSDSRARAAHSDRDAAAVPLKLLHAYGGPQADTLAGELESDELAADGEVEGRTARTRMQDLAEPFMGSTADREQQNGDHVADPLTHDRADA
jgi:hypothetical protein